MTRINFFATKGGQGVTTLAAAYAISHQLWFDSTALVVQDEWCAHLGLATIDDALMPYEFKEGVWAVREHMLEDRMFDLVVGDLGVTFNLPAGDTNILVTRACYLALSLYVRKDISASGFILIDEPGRALTTLDIERCTGIPHLHTVPWTPTVSRTIDAGLLASRAPKDLRTWGKIDELVRPQPL